MNIKLFIFLNSIAFHTCLPKIQSESEAYAYCANHQNTYIALVWPIAQGHKEELKKIFNNYGKILYTKNIYTSPDMALSILKEAHPHINNMAAHLQWYFPPGTYNNPMRIFLFECPSLKDVLTCKRKIRHMFDLQYRSIHINDTYPETMSLAQRFFSKTKNEINCATITPEVAWLRSYLQHIYDTSHEDEWDQF